MLVTDAKTQKIFYFNTFLLFINKIVFVIFIFFVTDESFIANVIDTIWDRFNFLTSENFWL